MGRYGVSILSYNGSSLYLFLEIFLGEVEEEALDVIGAQPVDTPSINGSTQVVIHLLLWVLVLVVTTETKSENDKMFSLLRPQSSPKTKPL